MTELFTTKEAAPLLKMKPDTIRKHCQTGKIKGTKKPGGEWLISQKEIDNYLGVSPNDANENQEVARAEDRSKIAEAEASEAKALQEKVAYTLGFPTVDAYLQASKELAAKIENQDRIIRDAVKEEQERLVSEAGKANLALEAYNEKASHYEPENQKLRELCRLQKARNEELERLLEIKMEEEAQLIDDTTYFNNHKAEGIRLLRVIAKGMTTYRKGLSDYLNRQATGLESVDDYDVGIKCFHACSRSICRTAEWFQDNDGKVKEWDCGAVFDWLCSMDEKLVKTMRIPDTRGGGQEIPLVPQHEAMLDMIRDKVGAR